MEIVKFETAELQAIEKSKAEQIKLTFEPMVELLEGFEDSFNSLISETESVITKEITSKAKRLRIDIGQVRIKTEKIRKEQKEEYLRAGKAIDGVSNILKWAISDKEDKLKEIEKHFEIQEQKRLETLQFERVEKLAPYVEDAHERDLAKFANDEFEALLTMKKKEQEDRIAAEKKAEEDRIAKEKADAEEHERIRKENERLKKEAEEREKLAKIEAEKRAKKEAELKAKEEAERKAREEKARKEREVYEAKLKAEREEKKKHEKLIAELKAKEKAKREKLEAELKAKEDDERKAKEEEAARLQAELNKGDAAKVKDLITDLENLKIKYIFKSDKNKRKYSDVGLLIDKVINHINK